MFGMRDKGIQCQSILAVLILSITISTVAYITVWGLLIQNDFNRELSYMFGKHCKLHPAQALNFAFFARLQG